MLIAVFTNATTWDGRTITYKRGVYELENFGPITAQDVVRYAQSGSMRWASAEASRRVSADAATAKKAVYTTYGRKAVHSGGPTQAKKKGRMGNVIAFLILALVGLMLLTPLIGPVSLFLMGVLVFIAIVWALRRTGS